MIVLDASAAVDWLLQTSAGQSIEMRIYSRNETLHAPHLLDLEVTQVLRRLALQGVVPIRRAEEAVRDLLDLRITRYPHFVLLPRIWQLRHSLSAYDAAYDTADFVAECRNLNVTPHVAQNVGRLGGSAIDARTTQHPGYAISQRKRKRVEECFGWLKTIALLRKVRHRGIFKVGWVFTFAAAAYNLVRMRNLAIQTG